MGLCVCVFLCLLGVIVCLFFLSVIYSSGSWRRARILIYYVCIPLQGRNSIWSLCALICERMLVCIPVWGHTQRARLATDYGRTLDTSCTVKSFRHYTLCPSEREEPPSVSCSLLSIPSTNVPLSGPETSQTVYLLMPPQAIPFLTPLLYLSFSPLSHYLSVSVSVCLSVYLSLPLSLSLALSIWLLAFLFSFPLLHSFFFLFYYFLTFMFSLPFFCFPLSWIHYVILYASGEPGRRVRGFHSETKEDEGQRWRTRGVCVCFVLCVVCVCVCVCPSVRVFQNVCVLLSFWTQEGKQYTGDAHTATSHITQATFRSL